MKMVDYEKWKNEINELNAQIDEKIHHLKNNTPEYFVLIKKLQKKLSESWKK